MIKRTLIVFCLLAAGVVFCGPVFADVVLKAAPEKANGVYTSQEPVRFVITAEEDGKPAAGEVNIELLQNTAKKLEAKTLPLKDGKAVLEYHLKEPGCLMMIAKFKGVEAKSGAVVDPFKIQPSSPAPKDFDEFWKRQKEKLAAVKPNTKLTPLKDAPSAKWGPKVETFELQMDCTGGKPVSGYYARPVGAKPKSLPAVLSLHSAGIRSGSIRAAWNGAKRNRISLDINAHGLPNGKDTKYYKDLGAGELNRYAYKGMDDPNHYYFLGMFLRMVRAIDFLTSQPEWDGKTLIVHGASQGGGQSMVIAGLDPRVTDMNATVPAFCDVTADPKQRKAGWPGRIAKTEQELKTVSYFDACNFAARNKLKKSVVEVGLVDTTCSAAGIFAAFNQIPGEKEIIILPNRGHGGSRESKKNARKPEFRHKQSPAQK